MIFSRLTNSAGRCRFVEFCPNGTGFARHVLCGHGPVVQNVTARFTGLAGKEGAHGLIRARTAHGTNVRICFKLPTSVAREALLKTSMQGWVCCWIGQKPTAGAKLALGVVGCAGILIFPRLTNSAGRCRFVEFSPNGTGFACHVFAGQNTVVQSKPTRFTLPAN